MPDEPRGVAGAAIEAGRAVLAGLPPAFLALCLLNAAFLTVTMWFLSSQVEQRTAIVGKVLDGCLLQMGKHP